MCEAFNKTSVTKTLFRREQILTGAFDVTSCIRDFRAHIFSPQTAQELPKKHHEEGPPEQLPTDALSQIDYGHTSHCKRGLLVSTNNAKGNLKILSRALRMAG